MAPLCLVGQASTRGLSTASVMPEPAENKGYGNSVTTAQDVVTHNQAHQVLLSLCETVASRMRKDGKCGSCVSVHLRTNEFQHFCFSLFYFLYSTTYTLFLLFLRELS